MRIGEIYRPGTFGLSFEIFPPKSSDQDVTLFENLERLASYRPAFASCTYGAGGSTRVRTLDLCVEMQRRLGLTATAHFTCVGSTRDELREWLGSAQRSGITNIMALRGDPPVGQTEFQQVAGGLRYANELVELIRAEFPQFGIGVAGYPEKHPQAPSADVDLDNLKRKVATGADAVFTQVFFVNDSFFRFRERYAAAGIRAPLVPGIMPITNFAQIKRITSMCGAALPVELSAKLEATQEDKDAQFAIGVEFAIQQCRELVAQGVPGIHFYVLNRSAACERILDALPIA
ncbi:MAG: methylenetetrahydrofolate reductase [NAD(P)H] [Planctomycetales bacterium]|nr:methylenetetrahydrofolate reductase [NAD(P)H] [Planctomycetales bacterium]